MFLKNFSAEKNFLKILLALRNFSKKVLALRSYKASAWYVIVCSVTFLDSESNELKRIFLKATQNSEKKSLRVRIFYVI